MMTVGMALAVIQHAKAYSLYPKTLRTLLGGVSLVMIYVAELHWHTLTDLKLGITNVLLLVGVVTVIGSLFVLNYEYYRQGGTQRD
jgi:hypothetical protein